MLHLGGALNERDADDGAVGNRDARYVFGVKGMWEPDEPDARCVPRVGPRRVERASGRSRPAATTSTSRPPTRTKSASAAAYGANFERLVEVKRALRPRQPVPRRTATFAPDPGRRGSRLFTVGWRRWRGARHSPQALSLRRCERRTGPRTRRAPPALPAPPPRVRRRTSRASCGRGVRAPGRAGPGVPRLHGRRSVRGAQLSDHVDLLRRTVLGNPHSDQPDVGGDDRARRACTRGRAALLQRAADEYTVIFTPNATGALKLVGEAYPFDAGSRLLLTSDNHNSVNGIREFARAAGATVDVRAQRRARPARRRATGRTPACAWPTSGGNNLFAFPAQSNFSGVQHPLEWIARRTAPAGTCSLDARRSCRRTGSTSARGSRTSSALSFYKMFGYPTGVGCLLVASDALARLRGRGSRAAPSRSRRVQGDGHYLRRRRGGVRGRHGQLPQRCPPSSIGLRLPRADRRRHDPRRASAA